MASVDSTGTLSRPDHPAFRPTAPLPPAAAEAVARLELAFAPLPVRKAVIRYGICLETYARLAMLDRMSGAQFTLMAESQDELTRRHEELEQAGMLHLVGVE